MIKAFTILELVIVMVISSVITTAGYFAYRSSIVRLSIFQYSSQQNVDLSTINTLLNKDINECVYVSLTTPKRCLFKSGQKEIVYRFEEDAVYRDRDLITDTFSLKVIKIAAEPLTIDPFYLTRLSVTVECAGMQHLLVYGKEYTPHFLMNFGNQ